MFFLLHRLVKWCAWLCVLGCVAWLYTQRGVLEPLRAWYDVYENGGLEATQALPSIEGEGTTVLNGGTFQMKSGSKYISVTLTGLERQPPEREKERREFLRGAVVEKPVRVDITFSNANNVLGVVRANGTNLNLYYIRSGLAVFKPEYVKSAPRDIQYQFFAAARARAKESDAKRLAAQ